MSDARTKLWLSFFISSVVIGLMLFLSAGTIDYWQAWLYLGATGASSIPHMLLIARDPILLEARTKVGPRSEQRPIQKLIVASATIPGIAAFIVPGLDHRFAWSNVPVWLTISGDIFVVLSMWMVYQVFKENSFGSATIEVTENQRVISSGPYAIVRNPMYASGAVYLIAMSFALGSFWGLIPSFLTILCLVWRLFDEEKFLAENLPGYTDYCAKVRWHLIPGVF